MLQDHFTIYSKYFLVMEACTVVSSFVAGVRNNVSKLAVPSKTSAGNMIWELVFVLVSLYRSHYATDSIENCPGSAEPEDLGSSCGPISGVCFSLLLTGLFF